MRDRDTAASRLIDDLFKNYGTGAAIDIATKALADARAAGYAEAKADAANAVNADLSLFDEGMDGVPNVRDFVHVYKRRVALIIASLALAATKETT